MRSVCRLSGEQGGSAAICDCALETESLLFVSQQYHDSWQARSPSGPLKTVVVNGFYQGVLLPPGTAEVELRFLAWGRWSWVPQVGFVMLGLAFLLTSWRYRKVLDSSTQRDN